VAQIIDVIEGGGSLSEALGEPLERLYAEVMVLVSAADGKLKEAEARELVESFASDPLFHNVSPERAQDFVSEAVSALVAEGLPQRLHVLAHGLTTHAQRLKAYRLATKIAHAGGQEPTAAEQRILHILQATFGLADDEVARLALVWTEASGLGVFGALQDLATAVQTAGAAATAVGDAASATTCG